MSRISKKDLLRMEEWVNHFLQKTKIKIEKRYGYIAIDLYDPQGFFKSVLATELTKSQAFDILASLFMVLKEEAKDE